MVEGVSRQSHRFEPLLLQVYQFFIGGDVEEDESVQDEALFDCHVERRVGEEAGCVVDLKEVGGEGGVKHDIKAEYLEAD